MDGRRGDCGECERGDDDDDDADRRCHGDGDVSDANLAPTQYTLTVNSGTGSGSYTAGATVDLVAASAPSGQEFDQWTGDVGTVANVNAATTTMTMPAANATVTATYRAVSAGGTFSFLPTDDAYLQGTTRFNDAYLKVEAGNRVAYLKFNVSGLSGSVGSATLQLRENGDLGSGTLRVYRGSHNSWTETTPDHGERARGERTTGHVYWRGLGRAGGERGCEFADHGRRDLFGDREDGRGRERHLVRVGGKHAPAATHGRDGGGGVGASTYALTVNSGTGSGSYPAGATVDLVAASAPSGQEFDRWTGDVGTVANVNAATTTMTMPTADATVTATYRDSEADPGGVHTHGEQRHGLGQLHCGRDSGPGGGKRALGPGVRPVDGRCGDCGECERGDDDDDDAGRQCHGDGDVSGGQRRWDLQLSADGRRLPAGDDAVQ